MSVAASQARAALTEARKAEIALLVEVGYLRSELEMAQKQIRADHAYTASVAGQPCRCEWCSA